MMNKLIKMAENGSLPNFLIKAGISKLCKDRLNWSDNLGPDKLQEHNQLWVNKLKIAIALVPEKLMNNTMKYLLLFLILYLVSI